MQESKILQDEVLVKKGKLEELIPEAKSIEKSDLGSIAKDISFLSEVCLPIDVELGHSKLKIKEILELGPGSIVQLDKLPDEPVELFIGDKPFARGEVVVAGDRLGVRITQLFSSSVKGES